MISGIYQIFNIVTGMMYVGSAVHFKRRWKNHKIELRLKRHTNPYLQSAWNKYGETAFLFCKLEIVEERKNLVRREQLWINYFQSYDRTIGYNLCAVAGSVLGRKASDETKALLSRLRKGKPRTEEARINIGLGHKGKIVSAEARQRQSDAHKGHKHSEETKAKMSASRMGNQYNKGVKQSKETIEHRVSFLRGKKRSQETIDKVAAANRGKIRSPETLLKLSIAARNRHARERLEKSVKANDGTLDYTSDMWV